MPASAAETSPAGKPRRLRRLITRLVALAVVIPLGAILLLRFIPPPATPLMLIRVMEGHGWQRDWVSHEEIAPALAAAVVAAEDNLFCEQILGFDFHALRDQIDA